MLKIDRQIQLRMYLNVAKDVWPEFGLNPKHQKRYHKNAWVLFFGKVKQLDRAGKEF